MNCRVVGYILAGGRGTRMGTPHKGLLARADGRTILSHLVAEMFAAGAADVVLVANDPAPYARLGLAVIGDSRTGMGPLGGVEAALEHLAAGAGDAALILPCDLPGITRAQIARLLEAYGRNPGGVKFAAEADGGRLHPLCCVAGVDVLPAVRLALDEGRRGAAELWRRLGSEAVLFADADAFRNVNTPQELADWQERNRKTPGI